MKSSLCDLISDLHPNHVSAFQPVNILADNQRIRESLNLERSQPFSMNMPGFNLMESQPLFNHDSM